jgi:hypothetical protein
MSMIGGAKLDYRSSEHLAGGRGIVGDGVSDIHADIIVLSHVIVERSARGRNLLRMPCQTAALGRSEPFGGHSLKG